jgi:hypothetical protein
MPRQWHVHFHSFIIDDSIEEDSILSEDDDMLVSTIDHACGGDGGIAVRPLPISSTPLPLSSRSSRTNEEMLDSVATIDPLLKEMIYQKYRTEILAAMYITSSIQSTNNTTCESIVTDDRIEKNNNTATHEDRSVVNDTNSMIVASHAELSHHHHHHPTIVSQSVEQNTEGECSSPEDSHVETLPSNSSSGTPQQENSFNAVAYHRPPTSDTDGVTLSCPSSSTLVQESGIRSSSSHQSKKNDPPGMRDSISSTHAETRMIQDEEDESSSSNRRLKLLDTITLVQRRYVLQEEVRRKHCPVSIDLQ